MSEDQVDNTIEEPLTTDEADLVPKAVQPVEVFDGSLEDPFELPDEEKPVDDTGKTPEQILQESGVTKEEMDRVFPPEFTPLTVHPSKLEKGELIARIKEASERLKNHVEAKNPDAIKMPSVDEINQQYAESAPEKIKITNEGPNFTLDGLLDMIERGKEISDRIPLSDAIRKQVFDDINGIINNFIMTSELEKFDAKAARKLWLDKIRAQSRLPVIMSMIKTCATEGKSNTVIEYLMTYDRLKLQELGFLVTRRSGQTMSYDVSWE